MFPEGDEQDTETIETELTISLIEGKKQSFSDGELINTAINLGTSFYPDLMYDQIVKNYSIAKKLYGPKIIKELTGYDPSYIEKNIHIPEFKKEVKKRIDQNLQKLKERGLLNEDYSLSDKALDLASLVLYVEELDSLIAHGFFGEKIHKKQFIYGEKEDVKEFKKQDRYRDIAIKSSVKRAIRRSHTKLIVEDLKSFNRQSKGTVNLVYALDASGSMKGKKIEMCKKAGVALAYKAIEAKDNVGLLVFGSDVRETLPPSNDFMLLLRKITEARAAKETNLANTIDKAATLFSEDGSKHLILITDAVPTTGKRPQQETLEAASRARAQDVTISLVGIQLDGEGKKLAEQIVAIGEGNLYIVKHLENIDKIVLEDYYSVI